MLVMRLRAWSHLVSDSVKLVWVLKCHYTTIKRQHCYLFLKNWTEYDCIVTIWEKKKFKSWVIFVWRIYNYLLPMIFQNRNIARTRLHKRTNGHYLLIFKIFIFKSSDIFIYKFRTYFCMRMHNLSYLGTISYIYQITS